MGDIVGTCITFGKQECAAIVAQKEKSGTRFIELLEQKVMDVIFQTHHEMERMPRSALVESFNASPPEKHYYGDLMIEVVYRLSDETRFRHTLHFVYVDRGRKLDGKLYTQQRREIPQH